jgi:glutamate 5-kinase
MRTKLLAASLAANAGIPAVILCGAAPETIYGLLEGRPAGTIFKADNGINPD